MLQLWLLIKLSLLDCQGCKRPTNIDAVIPDSFHLCILSVLRNRAVSVRLEQCLIKDVRFSSPGCHYMFQHYLSECQLYLETVPAMFRLELLENIFSLLFLSTSDFVQHTQKDSDSDPKTGQETQSECLSTPTDQNVEAGKSGSDETENQKPRSHGGHLDLGHFLHGCRGFLVDAAAMEGFLKLLKEGLEGMCVVGQQEGQDAGRALPRDAEAAASLGCSVTAETFGARLQRLSKRTAEAQWRLQIITSNQSTADGEL